MLLKVKHLNIGLNYGGLGDAIARAPAVKALLQDYPQFSVDLYVFPSVLPLYTEWFGNHPQVRGIHPLKDFDEITDGNLINFDHSWYFQLGMHLTDHAYLTLTQSMPRRRMPYLPLGSGQRVTSADSKLVCLTPNFTALNRSLDPLLWSEIIRQVKALGLTPVLLGSSKTEFAGEAYVAGETGCLDLRDKTTLLEAVAWMEKSIAVIGIDNGLIHLAACTKTPIIVAYSTQIPENRLPVRDEGEIKVVVTPSECRGCETWLRFVHNHDFKRCYTKTYNCVRAFTAEHFIAPLKELL
jgi:ADP-heptose:LPS heptosyltransferase